MIRLRTIPLTVSVLGLMVTAGCQHHQRRECCPCSCSPAAVQPATAPTPALPVLKSVPAEPAVRSTTIGNPS